MNKPRRARALSAGLASIVAAAITLATLPLTAPAATPAGITMCGTFAGPHWSYKGASGTHYLVYTRHGGACAFAMKWAPRLVTKKPHGSAYEITGGPSGWICANSVVHFGICSETVDGRPAPSSKAFAWAGKQ